MASVTVVNNTDKVRSEMSRQIKNALWALGSTAEGYAKSQCPVDTGRLRNSITHVEDEVNKVTYIGTNVEYAADVEYSNKPHKVGNAHFLRNAVSDHSDEYKKIVEEALKA